MSTVVVQLKLTPSPEQAAVLELSLRALNAQASRVSRIAHEQQTFRNFALRRLVYAEVRSAGIGSQAAQHVIKKVADAYATRRANVQAGNYGRPGSRRRQRVESRPITFRPEAAHPYDQRNLSFAVDARTISLWSLNGRLKDVPFACSPEAARMLAEHKRGESDLVVRDGTFYLAVTLEVSDPEVYEPNGFLGVDLGIANIATTSTGYRAAGRRINRYRRRQQRLRAKLQAKKTTSAKRLLKKRARKEQRRVRDTNHVISKRIVAEAERTSRGIALEELTGIRQRVRLRKPQRVTLHCWAFAQLAGFLTYKAKRSGVPLVFVDPAYTSQTCAECDHVDRGNRVDQATFICRGCGVVAHADRNASRAIAHRGSGVWDAGRMSHVPPANP